MKAFHGLIRAEIQNCALSHLVGSNVRLLTALILAVAAARQDRVVNILTAYNVCFIFIDLEMKKTNKYQSDFLFLLLGFRTRQFLHLFEINVLQDSRYLTDQLVSF